MAAQPVSHLGQPLCARVSSSKDGARTAATVHAPSGHSGSSRTVVGAISRAVHLVRLLDAAELPGPATGSPLPLGPKLSVNALHGTRVSR
ncbi:hypothetical protein [Streptomyces sp. NBC_00237]|uniref:hypothetical protein n=1 Tax=Streptomyces sp. NBC_00237 TaxID=2975687 RepID=UPI002B1DBF31|nr:hypothetical protein [Streptomyces sp. NBC_00237]